MTRRSSHVSALALALLLTAATAHALSIVESGFLGTTLSNDLAKQVEVGVGPDTCLYYGSLDGLKRRCAPTGTETLCDPNLQFPVGIAFSTGGTFGSAMYVADYAINDIYRASGCVAGALFAAVSSPGAIAFPPAGSAFGDFLYACTVYDGPIYRVSSTGVVTTWVDLKTGYLRFGPGGAWGTGLYATEWTTPGASGIVHVSAAGAVTPAVPNLYFPEGFDWGFDGDMFVTDVILGEIYRVKSNGTKTLFATLPGAADVAYRPGEDALYVVSNQGGLYRIARGGTTDVPGGARRELSLAVSPNPTPGACTIRLTTPAGGRTSARVVDAAGRRVRLLSDAWRPAGTHLLAWDGRDEAGALVRPGAYFAQVQVAGVSQVTRVSIVR